MTGFGNGLPPGCCEADIDRAFGDHCSSCAQPVPEGQSLCDCCEQEATHGEQEEETDGQAAG